MSVQERDEKGKHQHALRISATKTFTAWLFSNLVLLFMLLCIFISEQDFTHETWQQSNKTECKDKELEAPLFLADNEV